MTAKWVYRISTGLLVALYVVAGAGYLLNIAMLQQFFAGFGYPAYLVPIVKDLVLRALEDKLFAPARLAEL